MNPRPTNTRSTLQRPPGRVLALHRQGRVWRVLVAQVAGAPGAAGAGSGGSGGGAAVSVLDASTLDPAQPSALAALIREHKPARLIRILPSASAICRSTVVPDGAPDEVAAALSLLAEAELPAAIPAHRRAAGVITPGPRGSAPLALLIGWPERDDVEADPLADFPARSQLWAPEPVALAALAAAHGGCRAVLYADRHHGTAALLGAGPTRALARILRADATTDATWRSSITAALDQLGAAIGEALDPFKPGVVGDQSLRLDHAGAAGPAPFDAIPGVKRDAPWLSTYGIALGAVLAYAAADPALEPLLALQPDASTRSGSLPERLITWLSTPPRAAAIIALCVALVLLVPLGVAAARASALERRAGGTDALRERLAIADREAAFCDLLRARRWPMTKLLADVAGAAPVGIRVESIELSPEQSGPGLLVRGTAPSADAVTEFAKNLADSRIVTDIATPSIAAEGLGVLFQLQARVVAPLFRAKPAEDFAEQTLAQRMYGDAASRIDYTQVRDDAPDQRRPEPRRAPAREPSASSSTESPTPPAAPASTAAPPPPLTDEAIAAMDRTAVIREFGNRRLAATRAEAGTPDRQRLDDEVAKLRQRLDALRSGGGGQ